MLSTAEITRIDLKRTGTLGLGDPPCEPALKCNLWKEGKSQFTFHDRMEASLVICPGAEVKTEEIRAQILPTLLASQEFGSPYNLTKLGISTDYKWLWMGMTWRAPINPSSENGPYLVTSCCLPPQYKSMHLQICPKEEATIKSTQFWR